MGEFGPSIQVPPFFVRSLEVEMLERGIVCLVSGTLALVAVILLSWLPWLFSRKSSLGAESWSYCSTSQPVCDE